MKSDYIMKILLAFDSFKDCLSAGEVCETIATLLSKYYEIISMPLSDGGEGFAQILTKQFGGKIVSVNVCGPLGKMISAEYGIVGSTAYIESASACGLQLIPHCQRNPLITTSYGVGQMVNDAVKKGCEVIALGLGGTSTNDAGVGMLQALGIKFFDEMGENIGFGGQFLKGISSFDEKEKNVPAKIVCLCDVRNIFYGSKGAAKVFARQKGATEDAVEELDEGLHHFNGLIISEKGINLQHIEGSGSAGGMAGGLHAFMGAELCHGTDVIFEKMNLETAVKKADLIITGEGKSDRQTLMGKVAYEVGRLAKKHQKRIILLSGRIEDKTVLQTVFDDVFEITPLNQTLSEAINPSNTKKNIERIIHQINFERK